MMIEELIISIIMTLLGTCKLIIAAQMWIAYRKAKNKRAACSLFMLTLLFFISAFGSNLAIIAPVWPVYLVMFFEGALLLCAITFIIRRQVQIIVESLD